MKKYNRNYSIMMMDTIRTKIIGNNAVIPVIMFHSVGLENTSWVYSHLSEPLALFEAKISLLCRKGFNFIFWEDLYRCMAGAKDLPKPSIMLTFDDGYLDNWAYVYPILKKYNAKATIFINPDFVDPSTSPRTSFKVIQTPTINKEPGYTPAGFLNWPEIRKMVDSGLVDIQSHSLTHTWYYSGPEMIDVHRPGLCKYPWLEWNTRPESKYTYMQKNFTSLVPWGTPVFEYEKSLICHKYYPPDDVIKGIVTYVDNHGKETFFDKPAWADVINNLFKELMTRYKHKEKYETQEQYEARVLFELKESKRIIEENLNKPVNFLCFPGGGYNQKVLSLAKEAGYKAWTLASKDQSGYRNTPGTDPMQIKRLGASSQYRFRKKTYGMANDQYFLNIVKRHQGSFVHKWIARYKIFCVIINRILSRNKS